MPSVWNKRNPKTPRGAIYIGRGSKWGNLWTHHKGRTIAKFIVESREEAIAMYTEWLLFGEGRNLLRHLRELAGKDLVCWCKPAACHGDVLLRLAQFYFPAAV